MEDEPPPFEEIPDSAVRRINLLGLGVLLLFAAFAYFLWSHPSYIPACASNGKGRCGHWRATAAHLTAPAAR